MMTTEELEKKWRRLVTIESTLCIAIGLALVSMAGRVMFLVGYEDIGPRRNMDYAMLSTGSALAIGAGAALVLIIECRSIGRRIRLRRAMRRWTTPEWYIDPEIGEGRGQRNEIND
jgi:hypothetical protein